MSEVTPEKLVAAAAEAMPFATTKFKMGAALLTKSGKIYSGCNQTCAVSPLSMCAERVAIFKAVSEGETKFKALALIGAGSHDVYVCGSCRQVMRQYSLDMDVYLSNVNQEFRKNSLDKMLPDAYGPSFN